MVVFGVVMVFGVVVAAPDASLEFGFVVAVPPLSRPGFSEYVVVVVVVVVVICAGGECGMAAMPPSSIAR